ncbi:MAG: DUF1573 domain-containing protein [candidate division Zixibacteria bacterium]|nr:DUF1573 domain-containing protein [candidate division Zixibacteria bacterium]
MRRFVVLILVALLVAVGSLCAQQKGPHLLVVQPAFDYGFVPDSSKVAHTYWLNNIGTDSLRVFSVKVTCGCTKASVDRGVVAVNDSMPLEVVFDNLNRLKKQGRSAGILSNDPASSRYEVSFSCFTYVAGEATGPVAITKNKRLRLTTLDHGKDVVVTIKNVSKEPLEAKLIAYPSELVSVELPQGALAPGAKGDILVRVKSEIKNKNQFKSFTFEMSDAAKSRYTIPVRMSEPISTLKSPEKGR